MMYFDEMKNLSSLKKWLDLGVALIPVNDAKEPFVAFKGKNVLSLMDLLDSFRLHSQRDGTEINKVAIRVGLVSGGLVCIDVDSKYKEGFSEKFFVDLGLLFPELWDRFKIDRSPSGGLHVYYIIKEDEWSSDLVSKDVAHRYASEEELSLNPKRKTRCFIELKCGDGSLSTCFPSFGYSFVKDWNSEKLSLEEHMLLDSFLSAYNEISKEPTVIRSNKNRDGIYIEGKTPFDCFNISDSAGEVLIDLGWGRWKKYGGLETFIKPGGKKNRVGATFNPEKRTYAILTTGSEIETACYKASTLLCKEKFGGDAKSCFESLVSLGFGVLKPQIEKIEIKKAIRNGLEELPANFSNEAKEQFKTGIAKKDEKYPYDEFWIEDENGKYEISRELVCRVSSDIGFRSYKEKIVLIDLFLIKDVEDRVYFDTLKRYIGQEENIDLLDEFEDFLQKSGKFTITRLEPLDLSIVLRSTKKESYKFFKNCYIIINSDGVEVLDYSGLNFKVWEKDIKNREFSLFEGDVKNGLYWKFIKNAIGWSEYLMKCIGFYAHDFRDEESYLCITTEKCEDPKDGGGSGKNIFWKLFSLTTTFKSTAASMIKKDKIGRAHV